MLEDEQKLQTSDGTQLNSNAQKISHSRRILESVTNVSMDCSNNSSLRKLKRRSVIVKKQDDHRTEGYLKAEAQRMEECRLRLVN